MTSFKHVERLDGGEEKAKRAGEAVAHLRALVEAHESVEETSSSSLTSIPKASFRIVGEQI
jgi:hypothetical protein